MRKVPGALLDAIWLVFLTKRDTRGDNRCLVTGVEYYTSCELFEILL